MKKIISLLLALVMVMGLAVCASAASITINSNLDEKDGNTSGETYVAYKVFDATISGTNVAYTIVGEGEKKSQFYDIIDTYTYQDNDIFELTEINDTGVYNVKVAESFTAGTDEEKQAAAKDLAAKLKTAAMVSTETSTNGVFENLDTGYYLITDTLGAALIVDTLGDVEISTKNEYPSMTMKIVDGTNLVDSITAGYGGTITFEVTVTIPDTINQNIIVHDVLDADLQNIQLVAQDGVSVVTNKTDTACSQEFEIDYSKATNGEFTFRFTAQLKGDAATATAHPNTAWLTYSNFQSVSTTVNVYTYEFDVFKYTKSGDAENPLAGAGFVLMNSEKKYYSKNTDGIVIWENAITDDIVKTTGADGEINFDGLANGDYTLIEHVVPAGYNQANDVKVTINNANQTSNEIKVLNSTGSELPSTGGIGTTLFYVIGGLLMVGAVVVMVTKKRIS